MTVTPIAAAGSVQSAIALASTRTGIDFDYLLGQAQVESGLNARAAASTSSARGLYQFVEQSWLAVVKDHGAEHGMGWAADAIQADCVGRVTPVDPAMRQTVLGLRNDPTAASLMAAEHASDNKAALEGSLGRDATGTDLYMAHFLGLGGAKSFLGAMAGQPGPRRREHVPGRGARQPQHLLQRRRIAAFARRNLQPLRRQARQGRGGRRAPRRWRPTASAAPNAIAALYTVAGAEVVAGSGETADQATRWANQTLDAAERPRRPATRST